MEYEIGDVFYNKSDPNLQITYTIVGKSKTLCGKFFIVRTEHCCLLHMHERDIRLNFVSKRSVQFKNDIQELLNG